MKQIILTASLIAASLAAAPAMSNPAPAPAHAAPAAREAAIPFVDTGSIRNWRAVDRDTLYVQDTHNRWYRAELMSPCIDLPFAETIGFDVRGTNRFDRFASIVVRGQNCPLTSLVESSPPPRKARRHAA